jgi:Family of unknown function (DUF5335)
MTYEINREDWNRFFDSLSKRRFEWRTEVELLSPTLGDQTLNAALPFNGITVEGSGENTLLDISVGDVTGLHQSHTIKNPVRVEFLASETRGDVIDIEEADGTKTLIRFNEPSELLVGFAAVEVMAAAA